MPARTPRPAALLVACTLALITLTPVQAQNTSPAPPPPGPDTGVPAPAIKTIKFSLLFDRPGEYECYPIVDGQKGESITVPPGQANLDAEVSINTQGIEILDTVSGLVANVPLGKIKPGAKIPVKPDAFNQLQAVVIQLHSKNGELAAKGVIRLEPAKGDPIQYGLRTMDAGEVRFENIPLGKARIVAYANTGDDVVKQTTVIAPAKGGGPLIISLTLPVEVATVKPSPSPSGSGAATAPGPNGAPTVIVNTGENRPEPKNDWVSGLMGIAILGAGGFFGYRYMKQRGLTVKEALNQIGVDSPGAPVPSSPHAGLRSDNGVGTASPLPSLADLPVASVAKGPVSTEARPGFNGPRLIGLAGPAAGNTYALTSDTENMLSVGRDPLSTIPFPSDSAVSRRHAVFLVNGAGWDVMDEGSTNGTYLNGKRLEGRAALSPGDEIQIGMSRFRFEE